MPTCRAVFETVNVLKSKKVNVCTFARCLIDPIADRNTYGVSLSFAFLSLLSACIRMSVRMYTRSHDVFLLKPEIIHGGARARVCVFDIHHNISVKGSMTSRYSGWK